MREKVPAKARLPTWEASLIDGVAVRAKAGCEHQQDFISCIPSLCCSLLGSSSTWCPICNTLMCLLLPGQPPNSIDLTVICVIQCKKQETSMQLQNAHHRWHPATHGSVKPRQRIKHHAANASVRLSHCMEEQQCCRVVHQTSCQSLDPDAMFACVYLSWIPCCHPPSYLCAVESFMIISAEEVYLCRITRFKEGPRWHCAACWRHSAARESCSECAWRPSRSEAGCRAAAFPCHLLSLRPMQQSRPWTSSSQVVSS